MPVIMYSTFLSVEKADELYNIGANYYMAKGSLKDLRIILEKIITMMTEKKFERPSRDKFILNDILIIK